MALDIPNWKNKDASDKNMEELSIILQQILTKLSEFDKRLTAGGL